MKIKGLLSIKDLAGFRICRVSIASVSCGGGLLGFFPVINTRTKEMIICFSRRAMISIVEQLHPKNFEMFWEFALVHKKQKIGILLRDIVGREERPNYQIGEFRVLSNEDVTRKLRLKHFTFKWADEGLKGIFDTKPRDFRRKIRKELTRIRRGG